ncbi:hypothetical protein [Neptuniibacter sp. 2_MG-2023]|uniref:hypothetical protein n=1 Tax=Neptuniibacter sp. 2_MG-2023 TaxID=3062671 RepID=UPI0026E2FBC7|nr:hypothetical protein [Neptuniibacter sp. 2_MG-2023]MDO6513796.1 hypothetical protein [Neptuniibacter sp. 2_MG-2023]
MSNQVAQGQNLDDFLINLADGLTQAQSRLNKTPVLNAYGQEALVYHIPKMEFELKLDMTSTASSEGNNQSSYKKTKLAFRPSTSTNQTQSASSVIRGVMIATPIDSGRPTPIITLSAVKSATNQVKIEIRCQDSLGEPLGNSTAEINIDRELSNKLNKQEKRGSLNRGTKLNLATLELDAQGYASCQLQIAKTEAKNQIIAITADLLSQTETLLYRHQ